MRKALLVFVFIHFVSILLFAQQNKSGQRTSNDDKILITIGETNITKGEFVRIYNKNNSQTGTNGAEKKSLKEYLQMFIDFKLKVIEAEKLGLDTVASFKKEFGGYRKQLAKPYFVDESIIDSLVLEAYNRYQYEVRASHLLLKVATNATPDDTLTAYKKIISLRNKIERGASFADIVKQNTDDKGTKERGGDLGYFTAFQMIYPFESAAFDTEVGKVSQPIRTSYGYHLVYVTDKRKSRGKIQAAHIMKLAPEDGGEEKIKKAREEIYKIYDQLKGGADFAELAKIISDDKNSGRNGGDLGWFRAGSMVPKFAETAFALKSNGDLSEPVQTQFGWHIIKLIDRKGIETFDEIKKEFKEKISRDARASLSKDIVIQRIKAKNNFKDLGSISDFYKVVDSTIFQGKWKKEMAASLNKELFSIGEKVATQQEFADFLLVDKSRKRKTSVENFIDTKYKEFINKVVINYEEQRLEDNYPDFRYLLREYHDGILLFELTDQLVWSKAVKDTVGLKEFHGKNSDKYMWGERIDISVFEYHNAKTLKKTLKMLSSKSTKQLSDQDIVNTICKKDSTLLKFVENNKYEKTKNELADKAWEAYTANKTTHIAKDNVLVYVNKILPSGPKQFDDTKGIVTADYQNYLERKWIEELRNKYKITVNNKVLSTIEE